MDRPKRMFTTDKGWKKPLTTNASDVDGSGLRIFCTNLRPVFVYSL